jgi:hypothetical protein
MRWLVRKKKKKKKKQDPLRRLRRHLPRRPGGGEKIGLFLDGCRAMGMTGWKPVPPE